jgi:MtN3 and saliva related transmembrane protein
MNPVFALATAGTAIGLFSTAGLFLQARRLKRLGTACEISIPIRVLTLTGYGIWFGYGLVLGDIPLILVDLVGLAGAALVLQVTVVLRRQNPCELPTVEQGPRFIARRRSRQSTSEQAKGAGNGHV